MDGRVGRVGVGSSNIGGKDIFNEQYKFYFFIFQNEKIRYFKVLGVSSLKRGLYRGGCKNLSFRWNRHRPDMSIDVLVLGCQSNVFSFNRFLG